MKYNLKTESKEAVEYLNKLIAKQAIVEIIEKHKRRTTNQNSYLHLLLSYCAQEFGENIDWFKLNIFKILINRDIFVTDYKGSKIDISIKQIKSSRDVTTKEMSIAVNRLILFAGKEMSLQLPEANEFDKIRQLENHLEKIESEFKL